MTKKRQLRFTIIRSLVAILIGLLVATVLIFISATGNSLQARLSATQEALKQMLVGPLFRFSKKNGTVFEFKRLADILAAMIPTIFTGLSVCVMFSANQFNLGAEGGIMLGAFVSAMVAIYIPLPAGMHAVVAVLLGGLAVAIVMLLPALLKSRLNVSEMVCSLMLNYIIMYVIKFLMNTYLADKSKGVKSSPTPSRRPRTYRPSSTTRCSAARSSPGASSSPSPRWCCAGCSCTAPAGATPSA